MKRDILQEEPTLMEVVYQFVIGAVIVFILFAAAAVWDAVMHWISGC